MKDIKEHIAQTMAVIFEASMMALFIIFLAACLIAFQPEISAMTSAMR